MISLITSHERPLIPQYPSPATVSSDPCPTSVISKAPPLPSTVKWIATTFKTPVSLSSPFRQRRKLDLREAEQPVQDLRASMSLPWEAEPVRLQRLCSSCYSDPTAQHHGSLTKTHRSRLCHHAKCGWGLFENTGGVAVGKIHRCQNQRDEKR